MSDLDVTLPTVEAVDQSIERALIGGKQLLDEVLWQAENQAWRVKGFVSWVEFREAIYGDIVALVSSVDRMPAVPRLRAAGLSQQEVAATLGVSPRTIRRDQEETKGQMPNGSVPDTRVNSRGAVRPTTYTPRTDTSRGREPTEEEVRVGLEIGAAVVARLWLAPWRDLRIHLDEVVEPWLVSRPFDGKPEEHFRGLEKQLQQMESTMQELRAQYEKAVHHV